MKSTLLFSFKANISDAALSVFARNVSTRMVDNPKYAALKTAADEVKQRSDEFDLALQAAADGSSYLEMGNTKVICTVSGPGESRWGGRDRDAANRDHALVQAEINIAGFSALDRKRRGRGDKSVSTLSLLISKPLCFPYFVGRRC